MLLALAARSLRPMLVGKDATLPLTDLPRYTHEQLGLHGLMLSADLLAGRTRDDLTRLRDASDRARCSCLVLLEETPQQLAGADASAAAERIGRVMAAASLLGCNAAAVAVAAPDTPEALDIVAERFKALMGDAEQRELNLLILPGPSTPQQGLTSSPDRLTDLLKKIGGFRVGTMPDFADAASAEDMPAYLRRVTPYASAVLGTTLGFGVIEGELEDERAIVDHDGFNLGAAVEAIAAVGYDGAVGLDYRGPGDLEMGLRRSREAFANALAGNPGPFSLVQDEEIDDEMDAAAAALLDAIFNDENENEGEEEQDDEGGKAESLEESEQAVDDTGDEDGEPAADEEPAASATKSVKKTSKKKTTKKSSKKTGKQAAAQDPAEPTSEADAEDES
ncbi:MAG: sugar phosphate isomerase/epimerase [Phycisphaerales bacterium]|nr:sugar phosphate isomerase/epimerase [Phycisphaerales bacterium]